MTANFPSRRAVLAGGALLIGFRLAVPARAFAEGGNRSAIWPARPCSTPGSASSPTGM